MDIRTITIKGVTLPHLACLYGPWTPPPPLPTRAEVMTRDGVVIPTKIRECVVWTDEAVQYAVRRKKEGVMIRVIADELNAMQLCKARFTNQCVQNKITRLRDKGAF